MIYEKIDLYEYFHLAREGKEGGILTVYCRHDFHDLAPKLRPCMLVVAGGGYGFVSAREGEPIALNFMQKGYCAASLVYTINTSYPTPLLEGAMAMVYLRENAAKYSIDVNHVGAIGFSAGGHLTGMLATLFHAQPVKELLQERASLVRPDAVVLSYPVVTTEKAFTHEGTASIISGGDAKLREALSLEKCVTKDSAPAFIWHTFEDDVVPVKNSLVMANAYLEKGVAFDLHVFERGRHGASTADIETYSARELPLCARIPQWFPLALGWLQERGFVVSDLI